MHYIALCSYTFMPIKSAKEISSSLTTSAINIVEGSETDNSCFSDVTVLKTSFVKCGTLPP